MKIQSIDIGKLGEIITEYRDGKPWSSMISEKKAIEELAEKINEIIEKLNEN